MEHSLPQLMGETGPLAPPRVGAPRGPCSHDGTIIPDAMDKIWGTDLTTTVTGEGEAAVFVGLDHCAAAMPEPGCRAGSCEAWRPSWIWCRSTQFYRQ